MKIYNEYLWLKKWSLGMAVPILEFIDFRKWANGWEVEIGLLGPAPTWLALEPNLSHRSSCRDWVTCLPTGMDPGHLLPGRLINLGGTCQNGLIWHFHADWGCCYFSSFIKGHIRGSKAHWKVPEKERGCLGSAATSCVTLGELLPPLSLCWLSCQMGVISYFAGCWEDFI